MHGGDKPFHEYFWTYYETIAPNDRGCFL